MTSDRRQRIEELYHSAWERDGSQRALKEVEMTEGKVPERKVEREERAQRGSSRHCRCAREEGSDCGCTWHWIHPKGTRCRECGAGPAAVQD